MTTVLVPKPKLVTDKISSPPWQPVLKSSIKLTPSNEQLMYIKEVLDKACSDSNFAERAYESIYYILSNGDMPVSELMSLNPYKAVIGSASFVLHVLGKNFNEESVINFAGNNESTVFISDTELTTGVDMNVWKGPDTLPVMVISNGVESNVMNFTFLAS